jgi:uridine phosphorylase
MIPNATEVYHLPIRAEQVQGNGGAGRLFFLPGSDGRARRIGERFVDLQVCPSDRQLNVYLGRVTRDGRSVDVGAVGTGMGCPSMSIVATELIMLGVRRFIRVGTAGSMRPDIVRVGNLVIATAAVRDEATSDRYVARGYPALADHDLVSALETAAHRCGLADRTFKGLAHTKDALYARELDHGAASAENRAYMTQLREMGVLATEMETSHLFILSHVGTQAIAPLSETPLPAETIKSGSILAIVGDDAAFAHPDQIAATEDDAITVALEAALGLLGG